LGRVQRCWSKPSRRTSYAGPSDVQEWLTDAYIEETDMGLCLVIMTRIPNDLYYELRSRDVYMIYLNKQAQVGYSIE
jgi:hypothetical protein